MRFEHSAKVQAPPERVWEVYSDVSRWPEWTPTIDAVERLDEGPIRVGARTRILQPKLRPAIWEVTELEDGEYFEWVSRVPGLTMTAGHRVVGTPDGTVATGTVQYDGPLGWLLGRIYAKLTRSYIATECAKLKEVSESERSE